MATIRYEERVVELLERSVRLLTLLVTRGLPNSEMTQREQVQVLSSVGFGAKEIAEILGTTPGSVSVRLAELRRKSTPRARRGKEGTT